LGRNLSRKQEKAMFAKMQNSNSATGQASRKEIMKKAGLTKQKIFIKTVAGKKRKFIKKDTYEFDEVGLTKKDFKKRKTEAFPFAEGWFHIKK